VFGDKLLDRVAAERATGSGAEDRVRIVAAAFGQPVAQHGNGCRCQWRDAILAALAVAAQVRASTQVGVLAAQPDQFRQG
jgi:hypothetical protein